MFSHQGTIPAGSDVRPVRSVTDLLADGSLADRLRSFVNPAAVELAAVDRATPSAPLGPAPGEPSVVPTGPHEPASPPRRSGLAATVHEALGRFLAEDRRPGPSLAAAEGPALAAGTTLGVDSRGRRGETSALARLESLLISRPWAETSAPVTGLGSENGDGDPLAGLGSRGSPAADRLPLFPGAGEGLAGLFDAAPIARAAATPVATPLDLGRSSGSLIAGARGEAAPAGEARPGPSAGPGGSATADAETLAELASRLTLAAERLEQAAGRLTTRGPYPLASAPRPFPGRVDA